MLVLGYADWCGYCKKFMPVWKEFKDKYMPVLDIREVNADRDKEVVKALGMNGFPSIILLNGGKKIEYNGDRTIESLEAFIRENVNPHLKNNLSDYRPKV